MPTPGNPKIVFTGNTFYQAWRAYVNRLVPPADRVSFRKVVPDFSSYTAINSTFPARVRVAEYDTRFLQLKKHVQGTGTSPSENWTTFRTTDNIVYDVNVGKYGKRWIGGPFFAEKARKFFKPSTRMDHKMDPYHIPIWLGGPGKFWYSDNAICDVDPYAGDIAHGSRVTTDPRDLFNSFVVANNLVQGARLDSDPGRPMYSFGQAIAELRDLPRLLKLAGDTFLQKGGSSFLSYEFGWKPLISDVRKLFDFSSSIRKRLEFLKKTEGQPIKRQRLLFDLRGTPGTTRTQSVGNAGYGQVSIKAGTYAVSDDWWMRAWYKSTIKFDIPDDIPEWRWEREATNILRGTHVDGSLLWQITPWSWLIDWFSRVGEIVEREFGTSAVSTQFLSEWIMINARCNSRLEVPCVWKVNSGSPYVPAGYSSCTSYREVKARQVPTTTSVPLLRLEHILSIRQSAVLFALFTARSRWDSMGKR